MEMRRGLTDHGIEPEVADERVRADASQAQPPTTIIEFRGGPHRHLKARRHSGAPAAPISQRQRQSPEQAAPDHNLAGRGPDFQLRADQPGDFPNSEANIPFLLPVGGPVRGPESSFDSYAVSTAGISLFWEAMR